MQINSKYTLYRSARPMVCTGGPKSNSRESQISIRPSGQSVGDSVLSGLARTMASHGTYISW